jgi:cellulose biosynthesis protein BcsQ
MITIAIIGRKGGSGKSTTSHLLAYGLGMMGYPVMMTQTDVRTRTPPTDILQGRPYMLSGIRHDARDSAEQLSSIIERTARIPGSVLVIDGGANRRNIDLAVSEISNFVIIPAATGPEDLQVAEADMAEIAAHLGMRNRKIPVAYILNRWPGVKRRLEMLFARDYVKQFLDATSKQRMETVIPDLTSMIDLGLDEDVKAQVAVRRAASMLAEEVKSIVKMPPPPDDSEVDAPKVTYSVEETGARL